MLRNLDTTWGGSLRVTSGLAGALVGVTGIVGVVGVDWGDRFLWDNWCERRINRCEEVSFIDGGTQKGFEGLIGIGIERKHWIFRIFLDGGRKIGIER